MLVAGGGGKKERFPLFSRPPMLVDHLTCLLFHRLLLLYHYVCPNRPQKGFCVVVSSSGQIERDKCGKSAWRTHIFMQMRNTGTNQPIWPTKRAFENWGEHMRAWGYERFLKLPLLFPVDFLTFFQLCNKGDIVSRSQHPWRVWRPRLSLP